MQSASRSEAPILAQAGYHQVRRYPGRHQHMTLAMAALVRRMSWEDPFLLCPCPWRRRRRHQARTSHYNGADTAPELAVSRGKVAVLGHVYVVEEREHPGQDVYARIHVGAREVAAHLPQGRVFAGVYRGDGRRAVGGQPDQ